MDNLGLDIGRQEKSPEGLNIEKYSLTYFFRMIFSNRAMVA
jgi:hypothetical protein